jgi:2-oxoglutarate-Fe(II)-dependent oxygenase superfamily protein
LGKLTTKDLSVPKTTPEEMSVGGRLLCEEMAEFREEVQSVFSTHLYEADECQRILEALRSLDSWKPARVREEQENGNSSSLARPDIRSADYLDSAEMHQLYADFDEKLDTMHAILRERWRLELTRHDGTHLLRYGPGGHYVPHQDTGPGFEDRFFSVVCYLNDGFIGGRTIFPTLDYAATPQAGKAILFPSNYLHGSEPIISGEKFVFVSWICGTTPVKWI